MLPLPPAPKDDQRTETQSSLDLLAKQMRDAEIVLLRSDARCARKIGAREIAKKKMGVVDVDT
jgi:hypothetical protein